MKRAALAVTVATLALLAARAPAATTPAISYTPAQAWQGRLTFYEHCAECHGGNLAGQFGPALAGPKGELQWEAGRDVYAYITSAMPHGDPGGLSTQDYVDVMAFLYQQHGKPSGTKALTEKAIEGDATLLGGG